MLLPGSPTGVSAGPGACAQPAPLPSFCGSYVALWYGLPALILLGVWVSLQPTLVLDLVVAGLPPELRNLPPDRMNLLSNELKNLVAGTPAGGSQDPLLFEAANRYLGLRGLGTAFLWVLVLTLVASGGAYSWLSLTPTLRARNRVERVTGLLLILSSALAHLHHPRHLAVGAVRGPPVLPSGARRRAPARAEMESPDGPAR